MEDQDYYRILQVDPDATPDQIKAAFRRLALIYHPDLAKDPQAPEQMKRLNVAYEVLRDPSKRAEYDQLRLSQADTSPVHVPVEVPVDPPFEPARPERPARRSSRRAARPRAWMRSGLNVVAIVLIAVAVLFVWSLITGQVSTIAIILLVLLSVYAILSFIMEIRRP